MTALPYADDTFDVVLMAHVLEHIGDPQAALAELYRVLKPGGIIITSITRRSSAGAYIQFVWRTHQVSICCALEWLRGGGFEAARAVPFKRDTLARRFSVGYVGRKPA